MKELIESTKRLQGEIDKCTMKLIHARQYHDKIEEAGAVFDMECLLVASAQQLQCCIDKLEDCGSVVEWQMGEPTEEGECIVTLDNGVVTYDEYCCATDSDGDDMFFWRYWDEDKVVAWCKLSNIKPYKEKEE